ncbi:hypothetical protein GCM10009127_13980 [Alteraurantiacibacter aestuarii]|uniref:DUF8021 domain-containing protein n=1 Tax=Alteraurantiacibacter aestuarii TaxID=650004 RepID=A0A844ZL51_9SPHN|nr:hypothetical protein [Alteraurantiacibacter aestuarii]MXO88012.1 hypothetical protein [Alteraurantiacibacter aestuarii]
MAEFFRAIHARACAAAGALMLLALLPQAASAQAPAAQAATAHDCDRQCLSGMITAYIDALVAHDPANLPLPEHVRFTEDSYEIEIGQGLWETVTAKGGFRQDYIDSARQIAAAHVELREGDIPVLYSLVLHVEDSRIAGIETLIQRIAPDSPWQPTQLGAPIRGMNDPVPAAQRQSRESMIRTALTYTEGLRIGNFTDGGTPFAAQTYRVENGVITAGPGCGRADCGMYAQRIMLHPDIIPSVAAVDEENGVVVLWMNFGFTNSYGDGNALVTYEAFKIWGGQIRSINAFFRTMPLATPRFWNSTDPIAIP